MIIGKSLHEKLETKLFTDIRCKVNTIFFDIKISNDVAANIIENINGKTSQQINIEL